MKWKFLEALLQIAVALSFAEWNFRDKPDTNPTNTYLPSSILHGRRDFPFSDLGPSTQSTKDEDLINSIINWEETQRLTRFTRNTTISAYPLVSFDADVPNFESNIASSPSSSSQSDFLSDVYGTWSSESSSPSNVLPESPGSSAEDGELFGAVGYSPQSSIQYFDIDRFLNADLSPEPSEDNDYLSRASPANWIDQSSVHSETVEELAQFLKDSVQCPDSEAFSSKESFGFSACNYAENSVSDDLEEALNVMLDVEEEKHDIASAAIPGMSVGKSSITEIEDSLATGFSDQHANALKGSHITGVSSYKDSIQDLTRLPQKKVKKEHFSTCKKTYPWDNVAENDSFDLKNKWETGAGQDELKQNRIFAHLPYTNEDLIEMEIEEFNIFILQLEPLQQHVAKDLRRRGKNKTAARNCRKRKVAAIDGLEFNLDGLDKEKQDLLNERTLLEEERAEITRKTQFLYKHIFRNLRDETGLPYSNEDFALTYTTDGSVYLVPKSPVEKNEIQAR